MSMIGDFGLCTKDSCNSLVNAIRNNQFEEVETWIKKICNELENSVSLMEHNPCSGEVYIALFQYLKTEYGIDIRENTDLEKLGENWREVTGDYDMAVFTEKEKTQLLSLAETIDYKQLTQYVNDFFQNDYGTAAQTACNVLFENLNKLEEDCVLIWHLY